MNDKHRGRKIVEPIEGIMEHVISSLDARTKRKCVQSGYYDMDCMAGGFAGGELTLIAGRPSMGVSSFLMNVTRNIALAGGTVLFLTLDSSKEKLVEAFLAMHAGIPRSAFRFGTVEAKTLHAARAMFPSKRVYVMEDYFPSIDELCEELAIAYHRSTLDLVVVDGIAEIEQPAGASSDTASKLKDFAIKSDAHVIVSVQLGHNVEDRLDHRPILSDLRHYNIWLPYLDKVILLYRDEVYEPETVDRGTAEVIIPFSREQITGTVRLSFESWTGRFSNLPVETEESSDLGPAR